MDNQIRLHIVLIFHVYRFKPHTKGFGALEMHLL